MPGIRPLRFVLATGLLFGSCFAAADAHAQKRERWKMQSAFGSSLAHLGTSGVRFTKNMERLSGGKFDIKFYEPGALVPALECFDAAAKGSVEACWTSAGYHTGKYPALAFFSTVPFGPQFGEFTAWKMFGGGNELRKEIYDQHGLVAFDVAMIGPETSGWFRKEVSSIEELKGLKMRFFGLGAKVMTKLGVSTQLLAAGDIYPALERGVIDATEFSMPAMDMSLGFYQIVKNNYYPGWHQQVSMNELLINKAAFEALPEEYKAMIEIAAGETIVHTYAETEAKNPDAMRIMAEKHGVQNRRWSDDMLREFEKAWNEVLNEESAKDELFRKVADSYLAFRKKYKPWGNAQRLAPTYLE